jgi:AcrR family transcriptional regulator
MAREIPWQGEPLPRGRHKLATDVVKGSQRQRLVRAMLESVAAHGYDMTTVPAVVSAAHVSRNAFYEFFDDKADCFLSALTEAAEEMLTELASLASETDWTQALSTGVARYLNWWKAHPTVAKAYFMGLPRLGERGDAHRDRTFAAYEELFVGLARRARAEQPGLPEVSPLAARALVYSITEIVAHEVRAGRTGSLTSLADDILELALVLLADGATTRRVLGRSRRSRGRPAA